MPKHVLPRYGHLRALLQRLTSTAQLAGSRSAGRLYLQVPSRSRRNSIGETPPPRQGSRTANHCFQDTPTGGWSENSCSSPGVACSIFRFPRCLPYVQARLVSSVRSTEPDGRPSDPPSQGARGRAMVLLLPTGVLAPWPRRVVGQQLRLLRQLWKKPLSARELTAVLNSEPEHSPMAHSTVQTLLRQLEAKGVVDHFQVGRTFIFRPLVEEGRSLAQATRHLLNRLFNGSVRGLVAHLLENEPVSPAELREIEQLIAARRKEASHP